MSPRLRLSDPSYTAPCPKCICWSCWPETRDAFVRRLLFRPSVLSGGQGIRQDKGAVESVSSSLRPRRLCASRVAKEWTSIARPATSRVVVSEPPLHHLLPRNDVAFQSHLHPITRQDGVQSTPRLDLTKVDVQALTTRQHRGLPAICRVISTALIIRLTLRFHLHQAGYSAPHL